MTFPLVLREGIWTPLPPLGAEAKINLARRVTLTDRRLRKDLPVGFGRLLDYDAASNRVKARFVGGWLQLGELSLTIVPGCLPEDDWLAPFMAWFSVAVRRRPSCARFLPGALGRDNTNTFVLDLLGLNFALQLRKAMAEQPLTAFVRERVRTSSTRGRLLTERNVRLLPHQMHALWYERSSLTVSEEHLRLLGWAAQWLRRRTSLQLSRDVLNHLMAELPDVDEPPLRAGHHGSRLTEGAAAYAEPIAIAKALATGRRRLGVSQRGESMATGGLVLNTYSAFEELVSGAWEKVARRRSWKHSDQDVRRLATVRQEDRTLDPRETRIDDSIASPTGEGLLLSDSKYKMRPYDDVSRDNLYQMVSTCLAHGLERGLLVLPHGPSPRTTFDIPSELLTRPIAIAAVRVAMTGTTPDGLLDELADELQQASDVMRPVPVGPA